MVAAKKASVGTKRVTKQAEPAVEAVNALVVVDEFRTVTMAGRDLRVKCPSGEQLLDHYEAIEIIRSLDVTSENLKALRMGVDQFYEVLCNIFVDEADVAWIARARKTGDLSMEMPDVLDVVERITVLYKDKLPTANREQRRTAARKKA